MVGVVIGSVEAGEAVSGLEFGFRIGDVEEMGTKLGIVVIGVVMSLSVVDFEAANTSCFSSSCLSTFTCLSASLCVLLEPVFEIPISRLLL